MGHHWVISAITNQQHQHQLDWAGKKCQGKKNDLSASFQSSSSLLAPCCSRNFLFFSFFGFLSRPPYQCHRRNRDKKRALRSLRCSMIRYEKEVRDDVYVVVLVLISKYIPRTSRRKSTTASLVIPSTSPSLPHTHSLAYIYIYISFSLSLSSLLFFM